MLVRWQVRRRYLRHLKLEGLCGIIKEFLHVSVKKSKEPRIMDIINQFRGGEN